MQSIKKATLEFSQQPLSVQADVGVLTASLNPEQQLELTSKPSQ